MYKTADSAYSAAQEEDGKRVGSSSDSGEPLQPDGSSPVQGCSPTAELISHNVEERLRAFLYSWGAKLVELQPKARSTALCKPTRWMAYAGTLWGPT
jgi:hypothetical protein